MHSQLKQFAGQHPISLFLIIAFTYTWGIWFASVLVPDDWGLRKIVTGMGFGPAVAAIILSLLNGTRCVENSYRWWAWFGISSSILLTSNLSILLSGDAKTAADFVAAAAVGFSPLNVILCVLSALIGGFVVAAAFARQTPVYSGYLNLKQPAIYLLAALFLPSVWLLGGLVLATMLNQQVTSVTAGLETLVWLSYVLRSVLFTFLVVAVGEELGWRGWLLPALQKTFSPLLSLLVLGTVWGLWHLPLYFNGGYDEPPHLVLAKVVLCCFLSILFTWFYNRTHGNVFVAILLHTAINSSQRFIPATEGMGMLMLLTIVALPFVDRMWRKTTL